MKKTSTSAPKVKEQTAAEQQQEQSTQAPAAQTLPMQLDVRVRPIQPKGNLLAFASMNINGCFAVEGLKVVNGKNGLFVNMPSQKDSQGQYRDVCFPLDKGFRQQISDAVLGEYNHVMTQMQSASQEQKQQTAPEMAMSM